jgi:hypothetical protein
MGEGMRLVMIGKLLVISLCVSLLSFALLPDSTMTGALKIFALGIVASIAITAFYPDLRGVRSGDTVSVVPDSALPGLIGKLGVAAECGRKKEKIKIVLNNGNEALGIIEAYTGLISPAKIRIVYEERLVD